MGTAAPTTGIPAPTPPFRTTRFARKYGPGPPRLPGSTFAGAAGYFGISGGAGQPPIVQSGLTPLSPLPANASRAARSRHESLLDYQRHVFLGFTSQELIDFGAMSKELDIGSLTLDPVGHKPLNNPIHPIFDRRRWTAFPINQINIENGYGPVS